MAALAWEDPVDMKGYREWGPRQAFLMPPSPMDWLAEDHVVYLLLDALEELDVSAIEAELQAKDHRGTRPYPPRMMVGLLLYGYCVGIVSSRRLEAATQNDIGFRVLCGGNNPDHSTISEFRKRFGQPLEGLFVQVLRLCQESGLVKLGHVALDGTKMKGSASKHKAMSHERMKKKEEELAAEIAAMLAEADRVDAVEDAEFGRDSRGDELPPDLRFREKRRQKLREARQALEAEAARAHAEHQRELAEKNATEAAEADEASREPAQRRAARSEDKARCTAATAIEQAESRVKSAAERAASMRTAARTATERREATVAEQTLEAARRELDKARELNRPLGCSKVERAELPEHHVAFDRHGAPQPKAQRNFTDPESKIMKAGDGYVQGYNCQAAVDEANQIIVAHAATNQAPDQEHLEPMLDRVIENTGHAPERLSADAGYWSEQNARHCEARGVDAFIPPDRKPKDPDADAGDSPRARMRQKIASEDGRSIYAKRKAIVEPVFGIIKQARGLRAFLRRGLSNIRMEWALMCTAHNLMKLLAARARDQRVRAT